MKSYHNIRSSRSSVKNIQIIQGGQDLTAQAGLIPVVKFLKKHDLRQILNRPWIINVVPLEFTTQWT